MRDLKNDQYRILVVLQLGVVIYLIFSRSGGDSPPGQAGGDAEVYQEVPRGLLTEWVEIEPANAVNFIIDHPERVPSDLATCFVVQAIMDLHHEGIEWMKDFPEGGD